jgi:hypothetical protein
MLAYPKIDLILTSTFLFFSLTLALTNNLFICKMFLNPSYDNLLSSAIKIGFNVSEVSS